MKEVPIKTETQPKVKKVPDNVITRRSKASNGNATLDESGKLLGNINGVQQGYIWPMC